MSIDSPGDDGENHEDEEQERQTNSHPPSPVPSSTRSLVAAYGPINSEGSRSPVPPEAQLEPTRAEDQQHPAGTDPLDSEPVNSEVNVQAEG